MGQRPSVRLSGKVLRLPSDASHVRNVSTAREIWLASADWGSPFPPKRVYYTINSGLRTEISRKPPAAGLSGLSQPDTA